MQIWEDIHSGRAEEDSKLLSRFLLISFADLKKWSFYYWFAFPAIVITPPVTASSVRPASESFTPAEVRAILANGSNMGLLDFLIVHSGRLLGTMNSGSLYLCVLSWCFFLS